MKCSQIHFCTVSKLSSTRWAHSHRRNGDFSKEISVWKRRFLVNGRPRSTEWSVAQGGSHFWQTIISSQPACARRKLDAIAAGKSRTIYMYAYWVYYIYACRYIPKGMMCVFLVLFSVNVHAAVLLFVFFFCNVRAELYLFLQPKSATMFTRAAKSMFLLFFLRQGLFGFHLCFQ